MSSPGRMNLVIYRGDDFSQPLQFTDGADVAIDITNWTVSAKLRTRPHTPALATITVTKTAPLTGGATISLAKAITAALPVGTAVWDLQATISGSVRTLLRGRVQVTADVTR